MPRRRSKTVGVVALLLLAASVASGERQPAEPVSEPSTPTSDPEAALTGDEIYKRVLENRFDKYDQTLRMRSGDRSGQAQETLLHVSYMSFREKSDKILSKTIAKYFEPQDVRHLGYLVVNKKEGADDQFIYRPSARRVRRVNLRGEAVFGTDFSFEDIIPQEYEDATYRRLPDEIVAEIDCFSVEVTPTAKAESNRSETARDGSRRVDSDPLGGDPPTVAH